MRKDSLLCLHETLVEVVHACLVDVFDALMLAVVVKADGAASDGNVELGELNEVTEVDDLLVELVEYLVLEERLLLGLLSLKVSQVAPDLVELAGLIVHLGVLSSRVFHVVVQVA